MVLIGLVLFAGSGAFAGLAIADNLGGGPYYSVHMLGHTLATLNSLAIFCSGLALALIFMTGIWPLGATRRAPSRCGPNAGIVPGAGLHGPELLASGR